MKKLTLPLLIVLLTLFISGCTGPKKEKKEVKLDKILASETLKDNLYNEVCFNVYEKTTKYDKPHYQHHNIACYYISVYDFSDKEIKDADDLKNLFKELDLSIFEEKTFTAYRKADVKYEDDEEFGAPVYTADPNDKKSLLPICHVNDKDAKYCISTYWEVYNGISTRYAIIKEKTEG